MAAELGQLQDETFARATEVTRTAYPPERRLTGQQLAEYLDRRVFAVVGSTRPDGRPHAAMSSYVRKGSSFWLPIAAGTVRERNVRHQPWMVLVVTEGERSEHVVVIVEGAATVVDVNAVPDEVATRTEEWVSVWLRLDARRVLSYASDAPSASPA
jgi:general stress protein 26